MDRRGVLRVLALSSLGVAGCNSGGGSGGRFRKGTTADPETEVPTLSGSVREALRVATAVSLADGTWTIRVSAGNTATAPANAEFSGVVVLADDAGRITSEAVERTVGAGEVQSFDIELAAAEDLTYTERTALRYHGFEVRLLVDGEPIESACPSPDSVAIAGGCRYRTPNETYVTVEYEGDWTGTVNADAFSTTIDRAEDGAPAGQSVSYVDVGDDTETVAVTVRRTDGGDGELTVRVHHDGSVVASDSAGDDDIVQVTATP